MSRYAVSLFLLFAAAPVLAQTAPETSTVGELTIRPVQHATLVLTHGETTIYVDPLGGAEAFVCMNLPYTMTVEQAADAVLAFRPRVVVPYHHRGSDVDRFEQLVRARDAGIEVERLDWYRE